ncbi:MAG: hypothetical protein ACLQDY_29730 [Streptosporangiaceae bacterium]
MGTALAELRVADGLGEELLDGDGLRVPDGDVEAGPLGAGEVDVALLPGEPDGIAGLVWPDEDEGRAAEEGDDVQAETVAPARTARAPQLTAVSRALSPAPAMAIRTFTEPPCASGRRQPRIPARQQDAERDPRGWPGRGACREKGPRIRREQERERPATAQTCTSPFTEI